MDSEGRRGNRFKNQQQQIWKLVSPQILKKDRLYAKRRDIKVGISVETQKRQNKANHGRYESWYLLGCQVSGDMTTGIS